MDSGSGQNKIYRNFALGIVGAAQPLPSGNGAGRDPRNPGKPDPPLGGERPENLPGTPSAASRYAQRIFNLFKFGKSNMQALKNLIT